MASGQRGQHAGGVDADLVVVGAVVPGDDVGVLELVALLAAGGLEADREGLQAVLTRLGEQPDDQAGVQATRQQAADGDVGDEAALDRGAQRGEDRVLPVGLRPVGALGGALEDRLPVGLLRSRAVGLDAHDGARLAACARPQDRARRGHHRVEAQVVVQRDRIEVGVHPARGDQGRQRRREPQRTRAATVVDVAPVQRLDAEPVARQHDPPGVGLGDGEGEHPLEVVDDALTPLAVALEDDLGVAVREEAVALAEQLAGAARGSCRCSR